MKEPVISPSGITYEKQLLHDHIYKNGNNDPITREKINITDIYSNTILLKAIKDFKMK